MAGATIHFTVNTEQLEQQLRVIARHLDACAAELALLREQQSTDDEPMRG